MCQAVYAANTPGMADLTQNIRNRIPGMGLADAGMGSIREPRCGTNMRGLTVREISLTTYHMSDIFDT
jgi:hypothetical protein